MSSDTRQQILDVAAALFTANGYAATGTREIAAKVGLRQASLFHYFPRKDDLLAELLDRTVTPSLEATGWLEGADADPSVRLYVLARIDATNLCCGPPNLGVLQLLPEARGLPAFWKKRAALRQRYGRVIHHAAARGDLIDVPRAVATDIVFGAIEATMTWYDTSTPLPPAGLAEAVASAAVRGILWRPPSPDRLRAAGDRLVRTRPESRREDVPQRKRPRSTPGP